MENTINNESLILTKQVFLILLESVINRFKELHKITKNYTDTQIFGFGNYDVELPNLKNDLEEILKEYVNGKYLYNKYREASSGKPFIKISRAYKYLYFNYLGHTGLTKFLESNVFTEKQRKKQLELNNKLYKSANYYYVAYYFGEDYKMTKGQITIFNEWKTIEMVYVYENNTEDKSIYTFYGTITQSEDFVFFNTKYYLDSKKKEGAKFIFFIGKSSPEERHYLIGTYCGFDKYDRAIAGKIILKKMNTKIETEEEVNDKSFDPIICQELNKKRIIIESNIKKNPLTFSEKSPFSQVLMNSYGKYIFKFKFEKNSYKLPLKIEKHHYNIISLNDSIIIEDDRIDVLNKGQILNLDFTISGIFQLQKVSVYINVLGFIETKEKIKGYFTGIDANNKIVSGILETEKCTQK